MPQPRSDRRQRILRKYATTKSEFTVAENVTLDIIEVENPYLLFDQAVERERHAPPGTSRSERLPYWAEVWPSALALARWFWELRPEPPPGAVRELGCGLGLVGVALARMGWQVQATDFVEDALAFAQANAAANRVAARHRVSYLDWENPAGHPTACAVASDVVYEQRSHAPLAALLGQLLLPGGTFFLSDPQRPAAAAFAALMRDRGYAHRVEPYALSWDARALKVDIHRFDRPF